MRTFLIRLLGGVTRSELRDAKRQERAAADQAARDHNRAVRTRLIAVLKKHGLDPEGADANVGYILSGVDA